MKIVNSDLIKFDKISEATDDQSPSSLITINKTNVNSVINGAHLELCVSHQGSFLIFTTDDCPFEESLNIYLLDKDNTIRDSATIFWPYGTGSFELIELGRSNFLIFKFFSDKVWKVEIYDNKRLHIPFISEPSGVWRKITFSRCFGISDISLLNSSHKALLNDHKNGS